MASSALDARVATHTALSRHQVVSGGLDSARLTSAIASISRLSWLCTVAVFSLSLHWLTTNIFVAKIIAVPPTTLLSFAMMRWFVFEQKQTD